MIFIGYGIANCVGVPVGTWLGEAVGWRVTLAGLGVLSLALAAWTRLALPAAIPQPRLGANSLAVLARDGAILTTIATGFLQAAAQFVFFAYISPWLRHSLGGGAAMTGIMIALYGAGGVLGNVAGARFSDRIGPVRVALACLLVMMASFLILALGHHSPVLTGFAIVVWGVASFPVASALQVRLLTLDPAIGSASVSFNNTATFGGAALGAMAGSVLIRVAGYGSLAWAGIALFVISVLALLLSARLSRGRPRRH
jgi:predicted MFS family arabinose efflux permease